jgi:hypothetical protein
MVKEKRLKVSANAKVEASAKATYQRKRITTEIIPPDVSRAKAGAWLDLISPLTEWAGLKGNEIRYRRQQLRIQREDVLSKIIQDARNRLQFSERKNTPIPNKFLVPFLEKASLEDEDSEIMKMWSELLVSAVSSYDPVYLRIIEILSQIGSGDLMKKTMNANTFIQTTFRKTSPFRAP